MAVCWKIVVYFYLVLLHLYSSAEDCQRLQLSFGYWRLDCRNLKLNSTLVESFKDATTFKEITFEENAITQLKKNQISNDYARNVEVFNVDNNRISEIEDGCFEAMHSLKTLNLARNQLDTISSNWFKGLDKKLETLDLSGNKISKIPDNAFIKLASLKILNLDKNPILEIRPASFSALNKLESLSMDNTMVSEFADSALTPLIHLELFSVRFGRLEHMPKLVSPTLKQVYFSGNPIETIQSYSFIKAPQLETVAFGWMSKLSSIEPNAFAHLNNLQTLQISNSKLLRHIHKSAFEPDFRLCDFSEVDFSNNSLTTLSEDLFNWIAVENVFLAGNRWNCSCEISWMLDPKVNIVDLSKCTYPVNLAQQLIKTLKKNFVNDRCTNLTKPALSSFAMNWTNVERVPPASVWSFTIVPLQFTVFPTPSNEFTYTYIENTSTEFRFRKGYLTLILLPIAILCWCLRKCGQSDEHQQCPATSDQPQALTTFFPNPPSQEINEESSWNSQSAPTKVV